MLIGGGSYLRAERQRVEIELHKPFSLLVNRLARFLSLIGFLHLSQI